MNPATDFRKYRARVWDDFFNRCGLPAVAVDLFECTSRREVMTINRGKTYVRPVLKRSEQMERLVISEVTKVTNDFRDETGLYDGLIYLMFREQEEGHIVPLYIGKSEKYGKSGNLSANIKDIEKNPDKFCRWGYNYAYHIGELSAAVLDHARSHHRANYTRWASGLFEESPTSKPTLKFDVKFWIKAWETNDVGLWEEFGPTNLTFLEYQLIGVASSLFPHDLLNNEGVNRAGE